MSQEPNWQRRDADLDPGHLSPQPLTFQPHRAALTLAEDRPPETDFPCYECRETGAWSLRQHVIPSRAQRLPNYSFIRPSLSSAYNRFMNLLVCLNGPFLFFFNFLHFEGEGGTGAQRLTGLDPMNCQIGSEPKPRVDASPTATQVPLNCPF